MPSDDSPSPVPEDAVWADGGWWWFDPPTSREPGRILFLTPWTPADQRTPPERLLKLLFAEQEEEERQKERQDDFHEVLNLFVYRGTFVDDDGTQWEIRYDDYGSDPLIWRRLKDAEEGQYVDWADPDVPRLVAWAHSEAAAWTDRAPPIPP